MIKLFVTAAMTAAALAAPGNALATDRAQAMIKAAPVLAGEDGSTTESIGVVIQAGADELWSGTLRIGGQYGNASFSMSKNEFAEPCPGNPVGNSQNSSSSFSLSFNLNRQNPNQERDKFAVNVNWNQPLPACQGEGSNMLGFNRIVEIAPGGTVSIEGAGGLVVRVTRRP